MNFSKVDDKRASVDDDYKGKVFLTRRKISLISMVNARLLSLFCQVHAIMLIGFISCVVYCDELIIRYVR